MAKFALALALALGSCAAAGAFEVKDCESAHIGIDALYGPFDKTARVFADGLVRVFNVDSEEPTSCAAGLAIAMHVGDQPGSSCHYVGCFASLSDVSTALANYDPKLGLLLQMKYGVFGAMGSSKPNLTVKIRINQKTDKVIIEK